MRFKLGVVAEEGKKPTRQHILLTTKDRKASSAKSDAYCNLPAVIRFGTRTPTKPEKALDVCGLCVRAVVAAGYEVNGLGAK